MRVLIAEDDGPSADYLSAVVRELGHEVAVARDGVEALESFEANRPDLVMTDVQMPMMSGLELLRAIRERSADTLVIMVTASDAQEFAIEAMQAKANDYLIKPMGIPELRALFEKYARIVEQSRIDVSIQSLYTERKFTLKLPNDIRYVGRVAEHLSWEASAFLQKTDRLSVRLGLEELLLNAVEHGNLEISHREKSQALEAGKSVLALYEERRRNPEFEARRVTVEGHLQPGDCEWFICDEGKGFNSGALADPTTTGRLTALHGRGIFLARFQFDELEYLGCGNRVRVRKQDDSATG